MAKKKMTLEEKLEDAIVKDTPYKVPENWILTKLGYLGKWGSGGTPSRKHPEYYEGKIPWIKTGELNNNYIYDAEEKITDEAIKKSSAKIFIKGSVLLAMYGATIGKVAILGIDATTNQACAAIECNELLINNKFMFYYLLSQKDNFIELGKGGAQPNISQMIIKEYKCPVPPIKEQQRIVGKIESLFEKLDKAKELIEEAREDFEKRKSAIMEKAFRGELTKEWRAENGIKNKSQIIAKILNDKKNVNIKDLKDRGDIQLGFPIPEVWEQCILNDISRVNKDSLVDGPFGSNLKTCDYTEFGVRLIQLQNIGVGYWKDSNKKFVSEEKANELSRCIALPGDIAIAKMAAPTARATVIPDFEKKYVIVADCIKLSVDYRVSTKYIMHCINSPKINNIAERLGKGTTRKRINLGDLRKIPIPLPSLEEQKEIVRIIDNILQEESRIEELTQLEDQIELIRKSILAKAFRGQLGTNCREDESALELLKEILNKE